MNLALNDNPVSPQVGRLEDESTNYVLPNHMLLKIATELPREMQVQEHGALHYTTL